MKGGVWHSHISAVICAFKSESTQSAAIHFICLYLGDIRLSALYLLRYLLGTYSHGRQIKIYIHRHHYTFQRSIVL